MENRVIQQLKKKVTVPCPFFAVCFHGQTQKDIFLLGIRCHIPAPHFDLPFFPMLRIPH